MWSAEVPVDRFISWEVMSKTPFDPKTPKPDDLANATDTKPIWYDRPAIAETRRVISKLDDDILPYPIWFPTVVALLAWLCYKA